MNPGACQEALFQLPVGCGAVSFDRDGKREVGACPTAGLPAITAQGVDAVASRNPGVVQRPHHRPGTGGQSWKMPEAEKTLGMQQLQVDNLRRADGRMANTCPPEQGEVTLARELPFEFHGKGICPS